MTASAALNCQTSVSGWVSPAMVSLQDGETPRSRSESDAVAKEASQDLARLIWSVHRTMLVMIAGLIAAARASRRIAQVASRERRSRTGIPLCRIASWQPPGNRAWAAECSPVR